MVEYDLPKKSKLNIGDSRKKRKISSKEGSKTLKGDQPTIGISEKDKKKLINKARDAFKSLKKHYPKIGTDY